MSWSSVFQSPDMLALFGAAAAFLLGHAVHMAIPSNSAAFAFIVVPMAIILMVVLALLIVGTFTLLVTQDRDSVDETPNHLANIGIVVVALLVGLMI